MKLDVVDNLLHISPQNEKELSLLTKVKDLVPFDNNFFTPLDNIYKVRDILKGVKNWERSVEFNNFIKSLSKDIIEVKIGATTSYLRGDIDTPLINYIDDACKYFLLASVNSQKYKRGVWDGNVHLFNKRFMSFPSGLANIVCECLERRGKKYVKYFTYVDSPPREFNWEPNKILTPTKDQIAAIEAALRHKRGQVKCPTGFGKTAVVSVGVTAGFGVPTLFLANKKSLLDDAKDSFISLLDGIDATKVHEIKDGKFCEQKINKNTEAKDIKDIDSHIICGTIQSLHARLKDNRTSKQLKKWLSKKCKLVIIDECQSINDKQWKDVLSECKAPYRIALSATPKRTDGATLLINAMTGDRIFNTSAQEQIEKGRLCELDINYLAFSHKLYNERDTDIVYSEAYSEWIVKNDKRNSLIVDKVVELVSEQRPTLLLINFIEHGEILYNKLIEAGFKEDEIKFVYGETKDKVRQQTISDFRQGKLKVLIGSTIFDAGVDVPVISGVVIAGAGNSEITLIQKIGRGARNVDFEKVLGYVPKFMIGKDQKETKVFDIYDKDVKFFSKQARNRVANAKEEFGEERVHIVGDVNTKITKTKNKKLGYEDSIDSELALVNSFSSLTKKTKKDNDTDDDVLKSLFDMFD